MFKPIYLKLVQWIKSFQKKKPTTRSANVEATPDTTAEFQTIGRS